MSETKLRTFEIEGMDDGIKPYVEVLRGHDVETFESCEGGDGHCFPEPTVRFHGDQGEGFRAFGIARIHGLPVATLRRCWSIQEGVPVGPQWEMTFCEKGGEAR